MARVLTAALLLTACATLPAVHASPAAADVAFADCSGHPRNPQGYVTDGTAQCGDQWCAGSVDQRAACLLARRLNCIGHPMPKADTMGCFAEVTDLYPWDHNEAFQVLFCESRGDTRATDGAYLGLMQLDGGPYDPAANISRAWRDFYAGRGWEPWTTAGMVCN